MFFFIRNASLNIKIHITAFECSIKITKKCHREVSSIGMNNA